MASLGATSPEPGAQVTVRIEGLRSHKGQVLACLTSQAGAFPDCRHDAAARKLAIPAADAVELDFGMIGPGIYAISLLHDENGNGHADMLLMIPREGFGFSRNAPVSFGPPSFKQASFTVSGAPVRETIRMRYIL
jgi:uncharacterized protein (DUF2141 family)